MKDILSILGSLLLIVPIYFLWLWIHACNLAGDYPRNVELYNSYLPDALRGRYTTSLLGFALSVCAIALNGFAFREKSSGFRIFSFVIIFLAGALAFLNLWSMM